MRHVLLAFFACSAVVLAGCEGESPTGEPAAASPRTEPLATLTLPSPTPLTATGIPRVAAEYAVEIVGSTAAGDSDALTPATVFSVLEPFQLSGTLVVIPTLPAPQGNVSNGPNSREFGLFAGSVEQSPVPGAIWVATNTLMFDGLTLVSDDIAAMDIAFVNAYDAENRVDVEPDRAFAILPSSATTFVNTFAVKSGAAAPNLIVSGGLKLYFSEDGQDVTGEVYVVGLGLTEPGTFLIDAELRGRRVS